MEQPISAAGVVKAANNLQQSDAFAELQRALNTQPDDAPNGDPVQFAAQSLVDIISGIKIQQSSDAAFLAHQQFITLANNELSDIRNEMLMAVNKVLDGADALSEAMEQLPDDVKSAAMDNVATIYEACSFQDITGQRIQNLLKAVSEIEEAWRAMFSILPMATRPGPDPTILLTRRPIRGRRPMLRALFETRIC